VNQLSNIASAATHLHEPPFGKRTQIGRLAAQPSIDGVISLFTDRYPKDFHAAAQTV
jgi:hypothetical protein